MVVVCTVTRLAVFSWVVVCTVTRLAVFSWVAGVRVV
jgi:hypothetical protein